MKDDDYIGHTFSRVWMVVAVYFDISKATWKKNLETSSARIKANLFQENIWKKMGVLSGTSNNLVLVREK